MNNNFFYPVSHTKLLDDFRRFVIFLFMIISCERQVVGGEWLKFVELLDNCNDQPSRQSTSHKWQYYIQKKKDCQFWFHGDIKGLVHPKMKIILLLFTLKSFKTARLSFIFATQIKLFLKSHNFCPKKQNFRSKKGSQYTKYRQYFWVNYSF